MYAAQIARHYLESKLIVEFNISKNMKIFAHILSKIPSDCPFARSFIVRDRVIKIPPLCKLNPFYDKLMTAKFWAMNYLEVHE